MEEPYEGTSLELAVVGKEPDVREKQLNFSEISLEELYNTPTDNYDAVFIMKEHLYEASKEKYIEMYRDKEMPFFFVESKASHVPFIKMENPESYEQTAEKIDDTQNFISGILYVGGEKEYRSWKFSYPIQDSEIIRDDVQGIYSAVFKVIDDLK
ncbi:hypothetical protein GLW20_09995 [Virgibacillus halodenitrificans]|nr:hypothetical protein [Virgibacillus halodenitrificans]